MVALSDWRVGHTCHMNEDHAQATGRPAIPGIAHIGTSGSQLHDERSLDECIA